MNRRVAKHFKATTAAALSVLTITLSALTPVAPASAAQTCSSSIKDSTIQGDVTVQGTCSIDGSRVDGKVRIEPGSTLLVKDSSLLGPIQGDRIKALEANGSNLAKGIVLTGGVESVKLSSTTVSGAPIVLSGAKVVDVKSSNIDTSLTLKDGTVNVTLTDSSVSSGLSCNRGISYRSIGSTVRGPISC